ncbi:hypothetical protein DL765_000704 [Monosporascus sp. GIB2]|nr:hypothetical protein DL765_000704 [Monosporascus sp. GIB2]
MRLYYPTFPGDKRPKGEIAVLSHEIPLRIGEDWEVYKNYTILTHPSARTLAIVDLAFIKRCLSRCEKKHAACSQQESQDADDHPTDIFLINVQKGCLEPANTSFRYFALSYVWGDGGFTKHVVKMSSLYESLDLFYLHGPSSNCLKQFKMR